jgi:hypothetical protein
LPSFGRIARQSGPASAKLFLEQGHIPKNLRTNGISFDLPLLKKMTKEKEPSETIAFDDPAAIIYWSKKWEISPIKLFIAFLKINSNRIDKLKYHLRKDGFAI